MDVAAIEQKVAAANVGNNDFFNDSFEKNWDGFDKNGFWGSCCDCWDCCDVVKKRWVLWSCGLKNDIDRLVNWCMRIVGGCSGQYQIG